MLRPALSSFSFAVLALVGCGGSADSSNSALAPAPCAVEVCGAAGADVTVQLTSFDRARGRLRGVVGSSIESFVVSAATQPLPAGPCEAAGAAPPWLLGAWNATAPMSPSGYFDMYDRNAGWQGLLVAFANAGADVSIRLAADLTTVQTLQPVCARSP